MRNRSGRTRSNLFNRGQRGSWGPTIGKGIVYLLNYSDATFTRSSEAAFFDPRLGVSGAFVESTAAANWKGTNEPRIFSDGAILIEGSRTNIVIRSQELDSWTALNSPTVTANALTAPDESTTADRIVWATGGSPGSVRTNGANVNPGDNQPFVFSAFMRATENSELLIRDKDANISRTTFDLVDSWERYWISDSDSGNTSTANMLVQFGEIADGATLNAWGAMVEVGTFASSPIRTFAASATRAQDNVSFPAGTYDAMATEPFKFTVWPEQSSSESDTFPIYVFPSNLGVEFNAGVARVVEYGVGTKVQSGALTWAARQPLTVTVNAAAGTITVEGATTGDGTFSGSPWTFSTGGSLQVGVNPFTAKLYGVLSRPRKV